jgi:subtilisin family serine protease
MRPTPVRVRLRRACWRLLLVLLAWTSPLDARADDDQFLLRVTSRAEADALAARYRLTIVREVRPGELYRVEIDDDRTDDEVEAEVGADVRAIGIERNRALDLPEIPPDVSLQQSTAAILEALPSRTLVPFQGLQVWNRYVEQPATRVINLAGAQALTTGAGVTVAVIDTGIDPNHPVLRDVLVPGYDFTRDQAGLPSELADLDQSTAAILEQSTAAILERDQVVSLNQSTAAILEGDRASQLAGRTFPRAFGHGTMVAGLVRLVAPQARIMPLKAFNADGTSTMSDLVRAVYYAVDHGATVINLSFTMTEESDELRRALKYAQERGVLSVASSGNNGRKLVLYPAAWSDAVGVGSTGDLDQRSVFSNFGSSVRIAAPGEGVVTTFPAGVFAAAWGTSFSTGIAAGAGALVMAAMPAATAAGDLEAREELAREALRQAIPIGQDLGSGRLDVQQAVRFVRAFTVGGSILPPDGDEDGDGMRNGFEVEYGLDPRDDSDDDDDDDGDGRTNKQEYLAGTHPRGRHRSYLPEGAVNALFSVRLALFNPGTTPAQVQLRFQRGIGGEVVRNIALPAGRRATLTARDVPELVDAEFSTSMESDVPVVVDRTMSWDDSLYGSHAEHAITTPPGLEWYLAEGATTGDFGLFYLLQNPGAADADVEITFLRPSPLPPVVYRTLVPKASRQTVWVNLIAGLERAEVSGVVRSVNGVPILAERAMYANTGGQLFAAGHGGAAVAAPALEWFLAEGATGPYFDTFVLVGNPGDAAADIDVTYLLPDGGTVQRRYAVAARSRLTIWIDQEDPRLADTAVSTRVTSRNGVPVVVERAMWWPQGRWQESHVSTGATTTGTAWALADGEEGGPSRTQTYVLLANPSSQAGVARVTLHFEDGGTLSRSFPIAASSRFNVAIAAEFPAAIGRRFATLVESLGTTPAPLVVERSMYSDGGGTTWTAGTNALATRLR